MQKRHVTQKAWCVRLVHGGHISRVLRGKTQGVSPRARMHARIHARIHSLTRTHVRARTRSYDVAEAPDDFKSD